MASPPDTETSGPLTRLRLFLSYAAEDEASVRDLSCRLRGEGIEVWLEERDQTPGRGGERGIQSAGHGHATDVPIICLSSRTWANQHPGSELPAPGEAGALMVLRLDACDVPEVWSSSSVPLIPLFAPDGYAQLLQALQTRAEAVGAVVSPLMLMERKSSRPPQSSMGLFVAALLVLIGCGLVVWQGIQPADMGSSVTSPTPGITITATGSPPMPTLILSPGSGRPVPETSLQRDERFVLYCD